MPWSAGELVASGCSTILIHLLQQIALSAELLIRLQGWLKTVAHFSAHAILCSTE